jgi:hypothetical protein
MHAAWFTGFASLWSPRWNPPRHTVLEQAEHDTYAADNGSGGVVRRAGRLRQPAPVIIAAPSVAPVASSIMISPPVIRLRA